MKPLAIFLASFLLLGFASSQKISKTTTTTKSVSVVEPGGVAKVGAKNFDIKIKTFLVNDYEGST